MADTRRAEGRRYVSETCSIIQHPVICAADIVERSPSSSLKRDDVVTTDPARVQCRDCRSRL